LFHNHDVGIDGNHLNSPHPPNFGPPAGAAPIAQGSRFTAATEVSAASAKPMVILQKRPTRIR
jgi:hypothetical protein